jgi:large subunit ribosomal protein L9
MKIILREHVEHLGDRGDEVNVAAGYARNYLLPKGLAYRAGAGSAKQIEDQKRAWAVREARSEKAAQELRALISGLDVSVRRRAGDGGTLYGSVTNADVAELLTDSGYNVDRRKIQLKEPIKSLGDYEVAVKLHRNVTAPLKVRVLTEAGQTLEQVEADRAALEPEPAAERSAQMDDGETDEGQEG